jgi:GPH family glycoside/pentoside/hexuronide:cation symporter
VCYSPAHPYLFLIPSLFLALGFCALWTLTTSMMADVCDLLELETGMRNEATLGAIYGWIMKLGTTLAFTLSGFILNATGFDIALGATQPERTIFLMRVLDLGLPTVAIAGAIFLTCFYPITEARARTIREELEKRRGALAEVS